MACRIPSSITSTGLYKEIAKFGKTAAQPFKNIQLSLNDTFNSLGSLSIPTPHKPGQLGGLSGLAGASSGGGGRPRSSGSGPGRITRDRRSQAGKLHHAYGDGSGSGNAGALGASQDLGLGGGGGVAGLVSALEGLQAGVKESTSLLRLDLQQHTALQVRGGCQEAMFLCHEAKG